MRTRQPDGKGVLVIEVAPPLTISESCALEDL
jgi:hypothetical protein